MKLTIEDVRKILKENEIEIRKFGVKEVYLFGSVVRGEAKETSDVDFLIVFEPTYPASFFTLWFENHANHLRDSALLFVVQI